MREVVWICAVVIIMLGAGSFIIFNEHWRDKRRMRKKRILSKWFLWLQSEGYELWEHRRTGELVMAAFFEDSPAEATRVAYWEGKSGEEVPRHHNTLTRIFKQSYKRVYNETQTLQ